ncbi:drug/metabolite transporter (DMT)-like permease [Bradyrhizobium niftali]|uniref:DMT family transporter n=1 Tax=Bradyrhizobium niftali TaxID=2560055 RepID=UPI003837AAA9
MHLNHNTRGAIYMVIAMLAFTSIDAITKHVMQSMNIGQLMFVRGIFATILIGLFANCQGAFRLSRSLMSAQVMFRTIGELGAAICFLLAVGFMPLANITAVLQAQPLAVTLGASIFYSETVGWRRWTAVLAGFLGVLIIVQPGMEGFNAYALMALVSVAFGTLRDLTTRSIPSTIPSPLISAVSALLICLMGAGLISPLGGWRPMSLESIGLLAVAAGLILVGYHSMIVATRVGEISFVTSFQYISLLWAMLLGYLMFNDVPTPFVIVGAVIIVASGLHTIYRERRVNRTMLVTSTQDA